MVRDCTTFATTPVGAAARTRPTGLAGVTVIEKLPLERSDEALDPLVVGLERVFAEDRLAFRVVQLQVDPVHAVVLALQVGLTDELAAQAGARRLRRHALGLLDRLLVGGPVHLIVGPKPGGGPFLRPDVVGLEGGRRKPPV